MISLEIDGCSVSVEPGTLVLAAAAQLGIDIPYFCHHKHLFPLGACRMCLVEIEKTPKLQTACTVPVTEGMVVRTNTASVQEARRSVLEFLLINHPLDCPVCDKGGECKLQNYVFAHGPGKSRFHGIKVKGRKALSLGAIVLDEERCVLCQRCTRFYREAVGEEVLALQHRGNHTVVGTFQDAPLPPPFSGNVAELCPVGALTTRSYRFRSRPWDLVGTKTICGHCSVGCNLRVDQRSGVPLRAVSAKNPLVDRGWACDRGNFGTNFAVSPERLTVPLVRTGGILREASWEEAVAAAATGIEDILTRGGGAKIAGLGGARLTDQEAYFYNRFVRTVLGTNHVDWRVYAQGRAIPWGGEASISDLRDADSVLLLETSLRETAPVLSLWLNRRTGRIISAGPLPTGEPGEVHHFYPPGAGASFLASFEPEGEKTVVVWNGEDSSLEEPLAALQERGKNVLLLISNSASNARGAESAGLLPDRLPGLIPWSAQGARSEVEAAWGVLPSCPGLDTGGILAAAAAGEIEGLYLVGANPILTYPEGKLARAALEKATFTVVHELFLTETAKLANVVFPAASWLEKDGTFTNLEGRRQPLQRALPTKHKSDGEILAILANALGRPLPWGGPDWQEEVEKGLALRTLVPPRTNVAGRTGKDDQTLRLLSRDYLFAGGGTAQACPEYARLSPALGVRLHPDDAKGLEDGKEVLVEADGATLETAIILDSRVPRGYALFPRRHPTLSAGSLGEGSPLRILPLKGGDKP